MLFLTYWELNENMSSEERVRIADELSAKGLYPPEGVNILRWDMTPDGWGILLAEADNPQAITRTLDVWRVAGGGFFKTTKTAPALPVKEILPLEREMLKAVTAAHGR
jgi:hypothetical protein